MTQAEQQAPTGRRKGRIVGRFEMYGKIASGGFAAIHLGRTVSAGGFSKTVAIKRLHQQFAEDRDVKRMFLDEARVVARVQHPNVVPTMDFVDQGGELFMVMEYVEGVTLGNLLHEMDEREQRIPLDIVLRIMVGALHGLHAAHEAKDERGEGMCVIHRDVSPDNILVGVDGHPRILDFGVARALGQYHATQEGHVKGKLNYMTPEQVSGEPLSCRTDVFAAAIVLWQCMAGKRLFEGGHVAELALKVTGQAIDPPSRHAPGLPRVLDEIVLRGLERDPAQRWQTADEMADELEQASTLATPGRVGKWVKLIAASRLAKRAEQVAAVERTPAPSMPADGSRPEIGDEGDVVDVLDEVEADETSTQASGGEKSYSAATTQVVKLASSKPRHTTAEGTEVIDADALERQRAARHGGAPPAGPAPPSEGSGPPSVRIPRGASAPNAAGLPGAVPSGLAKPRVVVQTGAGPVVPAAQAPPSSPVLAASPSHPGLAPAPPSAPGPSPAPSTPGLHAGPSHPGVLAVPSAPATPAPSAPAVAPRSEPSAPVPVPSGPGLVASPAAPSVDRGVDLDLDADEPLGRAAARRRKVVWGLGGVVVLALGVLAVGFVVSKPDHGSSEPAVEAAVEPAAPEPSSEATEPVEPEAAAEPEATAEPADDAEAEAEDVEPEPSAEPSATPVAVAPKATTAPPPRPAARPRPRPKPAAKSEEDLFARE